MTGVILSSGEVEYINCTKDAEDIIRRYVGDDLADYCKDKFEAADYETILAQEKAKTDEIAVMQENEELRNVIDEVQSLIENLMVNEFDRKERINRNKIYEELDKIDNYIQRNL